MNAEVWNAQPDTGVLLLSMCTPFTATIHLINNERFQPDDVQYHTKEPLTPSASMNMTMSSRYFNDLPTEHHWDAAE